MESFGLGIILNFVDNASTGMQNATNTFMTMSNTIQNASNATNTAMRNMAQGMIMNTLGRSLTGFGDKVTSVIKNIMNGVNSVGTEFRAFNVTLEQLYGSAEAAEEQTSKLLSFAVKSPFEVTDTKDLLIMLKAQGIEAFDTIKGEISGTEQATLNWFSDLMAFKPDVPAQRWRMAFQNYIGAGMQRSLKTVLGMGNVENIIGHKMSDTVEGRLNDIIEIVESKNLQGLTEEMMKTPTAVLSNIDDAITMIYKTIGDSGVFNSLFELIKIFADFLAYFDTESGKLPAVASIVSDAFNLMLKPILKLTQAVSDILKKFIDFALAHPAIAKVVIIMTALTGASFVALGWILRLSGSFLMLASSIKLLGGASTILSTIRSGVALLGGKLLAILPVLTLLYYAWKNNFMGIQDFVQNLSTKWELLSTYFKQGFFTDEQYDLAKQLGVTDLIEKIAILQYYWDYFKTGFGTGFSSAFDAFFNTFEKALKKFGETLDKMGIGNGLSMIFDGMGKSFSEFFAVGREADFEKMGEDVGKLAANIIILAGAIKLLDITITTFKALKWLTVGIGKWVISPLSKAFSWITLNWDWILVAFESTGEWIMLGLKAIGGWFTTLGEWIASACSVIWGGIEAIATYLGISAGWVVAIIVAIIAAVVLLIVYWDEVCNFFTTTLPNAFMTAVNAIGKFFTSIWNYLMNIPFVQAIVKVVTQIWNLIVNCVQIIIGIIRVAYEIVRGIIMTIVAVIVAVAKIVWAVISGIVQVIWSIISGLAQVIMSIVNVVYQFIRMIVLAIVWVIMEIVTTIWSIITSICSFIMNIASTVWNWIVQGAQWLYDILSPIFEAIGSFFSAVWNGIATVCSTVWNWISDAISTVADWVMGVWEPVRDFFDGIFSAIQGFGESCADAIGGAFEWLSGIVESCFGWIKDCIDAAGNFFGGIGNKIASAIPGFATGVENFAGGLAVVNEKGGEIVDLPRGTRVIPHDNSIKESMNEGIRLGIRAMSEYVAHTGLQTQTADSKPTVSEVKHIDNSVTFAQGSIVISTVGATQAEMEKAAEFIMKYIERKQQLKAMSIRS